MKKIVSFLLVVALSITCAEGYSVRKVSAVTKSEVLKAYNIYLSKKYPKKNSQDGLYLNASYDYRHIVDEFSVYDINNDGIPEVEYMDRSGSGLLYYEKGKVCCIGIDNGNGYAWIEKVYKKGKIFKVFSMKSDGYRYCKLSSSYNRKNGGFKPVAIYCGNNNFRLGEKKIYEINGKKVSKLRFSEFEKKINSIEEKKIEFHNNTKANRKKYLK